MRNLINVLSESCLVGIFLIIIGSFVSFIIRKINYAPELPEACRKWNQHHVMEIALFFTGFIAHLLLEYSPFGNVNKMFCETNFCPNKN